MLKTIGVAVLTLAVAYPAAAADWRMAGESETSVSFIDMASVAKVGTGVRFSRWMVMRAPLTTGADNLRDTFELDCGSRRYRVLQLIFLARDQTIRELKPSSSGIAEPGTVLHSVSDIACGASPTAGETVADPYAFAKERMAASPSE